MFESTSQEQVKLTPRQAAKMRRLLSAYIRASIDDSLKGGGHPEDVSLIEAELAYAKVKFFSLFSM